MPISSPGMMSALAPALISAGVVGISTPQLALGVSNALMSWIPMVTIVTIDVGVRGVGTGTLPLSLPPPVLLASFLKSLPENGVAGVLMSSLAMGLSNGLSQGFAQGIIFTQNPLVGVGTAVCKFVAPPLTPLLIAALVSAGMIGIAAPRLASGIGDALSQVFLSFSPVVPIVGAPSPSPSVGVGTGRIL